FALGYGPGARLAVLRGLVWLASRRDHLGSAFARDVGCRETDGVTERRSACDRDTAAARLRWRLVQGAGLCRRCASPLVALGLARGSPRAVDGEPRHQCRPS